MTHLTPLIELATQRSLDLFFRAGQGYVARQTHGAGGRQAGFGLSPLGVQARAETRIICTMPHPSPDARLHAWPDGTARRPRLTGGSR